ncbi:hypothetical protein ACP4OV_022371 [Aristida adscensionis]
MKRTRAPQPKAQDAQDPKPQRRGKQPRQPRGAKKPTAASRAAAAAAAAANAASAAASPPGMETAPTVPDVCGGAEEREEEAAEQAMDWDLDAGLSGAAWWTWGVDEEKLLGWFPFVEEDFRCLGGRAGDAEAAFDDDIWRIHQIYEIPN